jgi:putative flippase GtrA
MAEEVSDAEGSLTCALSVVVPTHNERDNIWYLLWALRNILADIPAEVIIIDDSDDGTAGVASKAIYTLGTPCFQIRCVHRLPGPSRIGGLATAVDLGVRLAHAPHIAVLDGDVRHPPEGLRRLFDIAIAHDADIVMATRFRRDGRYEGLPGSRPISRSLKWMTKLVFADHLLRVSDPLGGCFLVRRSLLEEVKLRPVGQKIALEVLIRCRWARLVEMPYRFRARRGGRLRQGVLAVWHVLRLLREVAAAGRFWKFCAVGASGFLIDLLIFALLLSHHAPLWLAWPAGTEAAILNNFAGGNLLFRGDSERRNPLLRLILYHGTAAVTTALNLVLFLVGTLISHGHAPLITQAVSIAGSTALGYWLAKRVVFRAHAPVQVIVVSDTFSTR